MQPIFFPAFYGTSQFGNNILQVRMRPESPQGNQEAERFAELEETLHSPLDRSARSES